MTARAATHLASVRNDSALVRRRWLFGPVPDLLFGCGLAYLLVFLALVVAGPEVQSVFTPAVLLLGGLVASTPHYGATLLRVYARREDRRAYAVFAVWITAVIAAVFAASTHVALVGSLLFTVYVTWNAWHYTGQNYGIALMFLGRRRVEVSAREKRLIYASFVLSYALVFISIHAGSAGYAPQAGQGGIVRFLPLGIPEVARNWGLSIVAVAYLVALLGSAVPLALRAGWRDLAPAALIAAVQAVWFAVPTLAQASGTLQSVTPFSQQFAQYAFFWVAYAHAIQYLWITIYYANARDQQVGRAGFFLKALLAGSVIWGIPALIFAPWALGGMPYDGGLILLVAAAVNIHHFVLDGAIWKLRDGRIARILIRNEAQRGAAPTRPERGFLAPVVWATGALCAVIFVCDNWERFFGYADAYARQDIPRMETAARRLSWMGRDIPELHFRLGVMLASRQRVPEAIAHFQRSIELNPSAPAWTALAEMREWQGQWDQAAAAYDSALALAPDHVPALQRSGFVLLRLGQAKSARARFARALALDPANQATAQGLRAAGG